MASSQAMTDIAHLLRPGHLQQLANILDDPEASDNDRFVALQLLKNANVAAGRILPGCQASTARTPPPPPLTLPWRCCARQDTGTAIVMGKRGHHTCGVSRAGLNQEGGGARVPGARYVLHVTSMK